MRALGAFFTMTMLVAVGMVIGAAVMQATSTNQETSGSGVRTLALSSGNTAAGGPAMHGSSVDATATAPPRTGSSMTFRVEDLGVCQYRQTCTMPSPAENGQIVMAHGDINDTGTCHYRIFTTGQTVTGLGHGTYRLLRITGTPQEIDAAVQRAADGAARDTGSCPRLG